MPAKKKSRSRRKRREADPGYLFSKIRTPGISDYVVVELRHDSRLGYTSAGFEGPTDTEKNGRVLNRTLERYGATSVQSHFACSKAEIAQRVTKAPSRLGIKVSADFAHGGFCPGQATTKKRYSRVGQGAEQDRRCVDRLCSTEASARSDRHRQLQQQ